MIISAGVDGVHIGVDWVAVPKNECRVVFPAGVVFSFFGLWERGMKWDEDGGTTEGRYRRGIQGRRSRVRPDQYRARGRMLNFGPQLEP